jgi:hypothetical protein
VDVFGSRFKCPSSKLIRIALDPGLFTVRSISYKKSSTSGLKRYEFVHAKPEVERNPMGEAGQVFFEPTFNRSVKVRSRDERLTSDAGVLLLREADHRLGLVESLGGRMYDPRNPLLIRYTLTELLRERLFAFAMGYSVADDADLLAHDPAMRIAVWDRPGDRSLEERLASQPTQSRLVDTLANFKGNLESLRSALADWIERHLRATGRDHAVMQGTIDVDGLPVTTYGSQPGAAFNGYYDEQVYYPLVASFAPNGNYDAKRLGDGFVHAILRKGNAGGAEGALRFIRTAYRKCKSFARVLDFRIDAAFTIGSVMDGLTDDGIRFVGRLRTNNVLEEIARPHVYRPVGRPPKEGYEYTVELGWYRAEPWRHAQRLILVVVDKPDPKTGQLELFPDYFFLVTSWREDEKSGADLLAHYRNRGTFEDRLGELSQAISARLSSPRFEENEAIFLLSLLAFNLATILRGELEEATPSGWDLGRLQRSVLKAGARVVTSARRLFVDVAKCVLPLWVLLTAQLERWSLPTKWPQPSGPHKRDWTPPPPHAHRCAVLRI